MTKWVYSFGGGNAAAGGGFQTLASLDLPAALLEEPGELRPRPPVVRDQQRAALRARPEPQRRASEPRPEIRARHSDLVVLPSIP